MTKLIKKYLDVVMVIGLGLIVVFGLMLGLSESLFPVNYAEATAASTTVNVSATVQSWITIGVSASSVTLTPDLVDTAGVTRIASSTNVNIQVGTNATSGWSLTTKGANGGLKSGSYLIASVSPTSTLSAGTDGYGLNATSAAAGVTIAGIYDYWGTDTVGQIASSSATTTASKTSANASTTVATIKIKAACDAAQAPGTYSDTITLTATTGT